MQLEPETAISRKGDTLMLGNRDTMYLSKSLAAIVGMHYDADHIYAVYQEMVVYWLNKREEFTGALPKADKREKANIRYRINRIDDQIKRLRQHIKNVELVAEDFKRIFVKSGDDAPSEDRAEAYHSMLDQFYEVSKLQTKMLEQYTHTYFVEGKGTVFVPALLVRTETPVKGESVEIGGLFYNVRTSSGVTVSHYVPVKKTRNKRKADEQQ